MTRVHLPQALSLCGQPPLPSDKSISHRALMLAAVAHGQSRLSHLALGEDVARTRACLEAMGVAIEGPDARGVTTVQGRGPMGLTAPHLPLQCGNSGTTMRLMMGLLAGLGLPATLIGDESLSSRPMARIAEPLRAMGARIDLTDGRHAPVVIHSGAPLQAPAAPWVLALPSGQLKGALLLAGLHASGTTTLKGALGGRDHTERLLAAFGATTTSTTGSLSIEGGQALQAADCTVPQDFSAAAFWLGASQLVPHAHLLMRPVGLNPTRTGFMHALLQMGANIHAEVTGVGPGTEPIGVLTAKSRSPDVARLRAITLKGDRIAPMIDELPMMMVMATQAQGVTTIQDAQELRVKETDRLAAMAQNLAAMGARIRLHADGCTIEGPQTLQHAELHSCGDHRIAMALSIAALIPAGTSTLNGPECMAVSDPHFLRTRNALSAHQEHAS